MTTAVSAEARSIVADLLALPPSVRNDWLRSVDDAWRAEVLRAVKAEMGTTFGLWQDDPIGFVELALGETLWGVQREILASVEANERTVVPSAHGVGKSHIAARAVAWWVSVWPPGTAKCITTATKWRQVQKLLWPQIRHVHAKGLPGVCLQTEWKINDVPTAWGLSPSDYDETAFSGIHAPHVLAVVDEAGGISPVLGQSLESVMSTDGARLLAIGNPPVDETGSPWMEQRTESENWTTISVPAEATPNFTGEITPRCRVHPDLPPHDIASHLITQRWVDNVVADEGRDSAYFIARVLARFPRDLEQKAIPRSWLEDAQQNEEPEAMDWLRLGVDVAADGGDRFSIALADGFVVSIVRSRRPPAGVTTFDLAGWVLEEIQAAEAIREERGIDRRIRVKIDALNMGMGVADTLTAWGWEGIHDADIVPVRVSERCTRPEQQERFANQRAELWWTGRELVQPQRDSGSQAVRLDVDDECVRELAGPKYGRNSSGRIQIETKDAMRKRGLRSPDDAEAVLLALFEPDDDFDEPIVRSASETLGRN